MTFRYKFENLLRLALHEEDGVKSRLALKDAQIAETDLKLRNLKGSFETALEDKTADLMAGNMGRVQMYIPYFVRLKKEQDFHSEERGRLVAQREKIMAELIEKRRVRKTYEKLRERKEQQFTKLELKRDQKRMDEFASRSESSMKEKEDA